MVQYSGNFEFQQPLESILDYSTSSRILPWQSQAILAVPWHQTGNH